MINVNVYCSNCEANSNIELIDYYDNDGEYDDTKITYCPYCGSKNIYYEENND